MAIIYSLDSRCQNILQMIMNTKGYLTIKEIASVNHVSRRSVYYDITKINEWLNAFTIEAIEIERNKGISISSSHALRIKEALHEVTKDIDYLFTPTQRVQIIVCSIIKKSHPLFIEDFISLCNVSRNTIINDLKIVASNLDTYHLTLSYENKLGYRIVGDFIKKVSLFFLYFNDLSGYYQKGIIPLDNKEIIYRIDEKLNRIEDELQTKYVSGVLFALATFFASINARTETLYFNSQDKIDIIKTKEYQLVKKYFKELEEDYKLYMALHLLGSRLQTVPINLMVDNDKKTYQLAKTLVQEFSNIACIEFTNQENVIKALYAHLQTSLYRYKYGIQLANPMLKNIKQEYRELFQLTKRSCSVLEQTLGVPIPDSEIAYITLHFGGFIMDSKEVKKELHILIICPNGVSTGNMLKAEIHQLVPQATCIDNIMLSEFNTHHHYDVVISTVDIDEEPDVLVVHPILTDNDRVTILRRCMKNSNENKLEVEEILNLAQRYMSKQNILLFKTDLENYFNSFSMVPSAPKKNFGLGMLNHLRTDTILICNTDYNWQEAITFASVPLLDNKSIEEEYVDSIIKKCNEMGPYMFITDTVVLAHAGINDGVNKLGLSFAKYNQPIAFNKYRKAEIIMVLATTDQVSHIRILNDIMMIFSKEKTIQKIIAQEYAKDILKVIENILLENKEN